MHRNLDGSFQHLSKPTMAISLFHQGAIAHQHRVQCPWPAKSACCFVFLIMFFLNFAAFFFLRCLCQKICGLPESSSFALRDQTLRTNSEHLRGCKSLTEVCLIRSSLACKFRRKVQIPLMLLCFLEDAGWFAVILSYKRFLNFNKSFEKKATTSY